MEKVVMLGNSRYRNCSLRTKLVDYGDWIEVIQYDGLEEPLVILLTRKQLKMISKYLDTKKKRIKPKKLQTGIPFALSYPDTSGFYKSMQQEES